MGRIRSLTAGAALALLCAGPGFAHHSGAMFDRAKTITLTGVVKKFEYTQPHSWIDVTVVDGGKTLDWAVEGGPPQNMKRMGVTPTSLKEGDKISIRVHPLKDGRPGGSFIDLTLPNGKVVGETFGGGAVPEPAPAPGASQ